MGKLILTLRDGQLSPRQSSTVGIPIADLSGDITSPLTQLESFADAIQGITLGHRIKKAVVAKTEDFVDVAAGTTDADASSDVTARREAKWLVRYHDDTSGNPATLEIPCANLALLDTVTRSKLNIASGAGATFKTFFESNAVGPDGGEAKLDEVIFVGRNT